MPSLAERAELIGFFSYSREDDEDSNGALSALRDRIQRELRGQLGRSPRDFRLWQDKSAIAPGTLWESEIKAAVAQSVFFIPIVTPTSTRSDFCRFEFQAFLERERELGRNDLIFPLLYIRVPALEDSARAEADPVLSMIAPRQYVDWREFRHRDVYSTPVSEAIERLCSKIVEALTRPDMSLAEAERRRREDAEQQRRLDAERQQQDQARATAEAERLANETRRSEQAARLAEETEQAEQAARRAEEKAKAEQAARVAEEMRRTEAEMPRRTEEQNRQPEQRLTPATKSSTTEDRALANVSAKLVPLLAIWYFVAVLLRGNVGPGALTMIRDLGFSASTFRSAANIYFISYLACILPSTMALERYGARTWIALLMLMSGVISGATAFIGGEAGFYMMRALLGAVQAGVFSGMIVYLFRWFPSQYRARAFGYIIAASTLASAVAVPVASTLLMLDGFAGLKGWQWLLILEGVPAIVLAGMAWQRLTDRPENACWLGSEDYDWLNARLEAERVQRETMSPSGVWQTLIHPKVVALSVVYFCLSAAVYSIVVTEPQTVRAFGLGDAPRALVMAIPFVFTTIGILWFARRSDRRMERKGHLVFAIGLGAVGLAVAAISNDPSLTMISLSVALAASFAAVTVFWTLPAAFLSGASAAAGIAGIIGLGALANLIMPFMFGVIRDTTGTFIVGQLFTAGLVVLAIVIVLFMRQDPTPDRPPPTGSR